MLRVYAAGGTGANIVSQIRDLDVETCYIDTSKSNLSGIDDDLIFLTPDMDGGGKNRSLVYDKFRHHVDDILIRFKPSDRLNVVISSLSGGSGSIIGPMVTKELISKGYNVIVIAVDSQHSVKEIDNTVKTLKTYQSFSDLTKKPISMFYIENTSRKEADQHAIRFINLLSLLVNKDHTAEFDTADLSNFINFTNVTDNQPSVSIIEINANETVIPEKGTSLVSTILVTTKSDGALSINPTIAAAKPEYLATCIVTDANYRNEDLRVDNVIGKLPLMVTALEESIQKHKDNKQLNKIVDMKVGPTNSDGLVL